MTKVMVTMEPPDKMSRCQSWWEEPQRSTVPGGRSFSGRWSR